MMKNKIILDSTAMTPETIASIIHLCTPGASGIAKNQDGEEVLVEVYPEYLRTSTFQSNHWIRVNEYYPDGTSCEYFDGKW